MRIWTYESQREHDKSRDGMHQQPWPKDAQIPKTYLQIPQEIARRERLDHTPRPRISPYSFLPAHALALLVSDHHPYCSCADEDALDQADDVDIPVDLASKRKTRVDGGEEAA